MRCKNVQKLLDDHVDGLLPAPRAERVREHLDQCEICSADVVAAQATASSMALWGDLEPPEGCFDHIMARIDALPPDALERPAPRLVFTRARVRQWVLNAGLGAAAALLIGISFWSGQREAPTYQGTRTYRADPVANFPRPGDLGAFAETRAGIARKQPVVIDIEDLEADPGLKRRPVVVPVSEPRRLPGDLPLPDEEGPR